jgi:ribosomal protein L22
MPRWLLPLLALAILAFLLSQFFRPRETETPAQAPVAAQTPAQAAATPAADVAGKFSTDVASVLSNVTQTLTGVTDAASANAALPKLKDASAQLDTLKGMWGQVPDSAKPAIKSALSSAIANAEQLQGKITAIPGVGDIIQAPTKEILDKLKGFLA